MSVSITVVKGGNEGTGGTYSWLRQRVSAADAVEMRRMVERRESVDAW